MNLMEIFGSFLNREFILLVFSIHYWGLFIYFFSLKENVEENILERLILVFLNTKKIEIFLFVMNAILIYLLVFKFINNFFEYFVKMGAYPIPVFHWVFQFIEGIFQYLF